MHRLLEIIMPPTNDVVVAVAEIMEPFSENNESEDASSFKFWDWYQIGGRYSGKKLQARIGADRMQAFQDELLRKEITVSGLQFGKPELQPASQQADVDQLWREMCPGGGDVCPLFKHSGEQHGESDICLLKDMPNELTAYAVIVASHKFNSQGFEAQHMIHKDMWNGVSHVDTKWNGMVASAIQDHIDRIKNYKEEWKEKNTPQSDWLVVTVDYHS